MVEAKEATPTKKEPEARADHAMVVTTRPSIKRILMLAAVVVVLVAVAVAFGVWKHQQDKKNAAAADAKQFNQLTTATNANQSDSQLNSTASAWVSYAHTTTNRSHQVAAYTNAVASYLNSNQYAKALSACQESEKVDGLTFQLAEGCAYAASGLGDKSAAIHYYQQAIRLVPANLSDKSEEVGVFNMAIKQLQAKP